MKRVSKKRVSKKGIARTQALRQTERAAEIIEEVAEEAARAAQPTHAGTSSLVTHVCTYLLSRPALPTYPPTSSLLSPRPALPPPPRCNPWSSMAHYICVA